MTAMVSSLGERFDSMRLARDLRSKEEECLLRPEENKRMVCFIRHGQASHNVCPENIHTPDNALTDEGVRQCERARGLWARQVFQEAELLVVSPLTRALQTAYLLNGEKADDSRFLVTPLCRERWSAKCDEGSCKTELIERLPWIQGWNGLPELSEKFWSASLEDEPKRVTEFLDFLRNRPERKIVVVAHGGFLRWITGSHMGNVDYRVLPLEDIKNPAPC